MASTVWKGHLTFGLVSVPVRMYAAARPESVSFNQIHPSCGARVKQKLYCPTCDVPVERKELVRGAEVEEGRYVIIEDAEIEGMSPEPNRSLDILEFVKLDEVDPMYFDTSYFLVPEGKAGEKPYYLLQRTLEEMQQAAIARLVKNQREHTVIVRPSRGGLMLHTLYYADEVRTAPDYGHPDRAEISDKELELARMFVTTLETEFDLNKYHDRYRTNLRALIDAKAQGQVVATPAAAPMPPAMDLMSALKASLERTRAMPPARPPLESETTPAAQAN